MDTREESGLDFQESVPSHFLHERKCDSSNQIVRTGVMFTSPFQSINGNQKENENDIFVATCKRLRN